MAMHVAPATGSSMECMEHEVPATGSLENDLNGLSTDILESLKSPSIKQICEQLVGCSNIEFY